MNRFFPPRYFATGGSAKCGSWLSGSALDDAILDSKKGARIGGTIAASLGGAALGFGGAEAVGHTFAKNTFMQGQKALDDVAFLKSKLAEKEDAEKGAIVEYILAMQDLRRLCDEAKNANPHCTNGDLKREIADIDVSKYGDNVASNAR
jgi:hypothetical protein